VTISAAAADDTTTSICPVMGTLLDDERLAQRRNGRTGFVSLYVALRRLGFGPLLVMTGFMPGAVIVNGWLRVPVNLVTLSVDFRRMVGGPVDHPSDTGILKDGVFHPSRLERMIGFASRGTALSLDDVVRLIATDAVDDPSRLGRFMSCVEFAALLRVFGVDPATPGDRGLHLPVSTLVDLYEHGRLPTGWRAVRRTGLLSFVLFVRQLNRATAQTASKLAVALR